MVPAGNPNSRQSPQLTPMKSAYELAMERLEKQSPTAKLTEAQKTEIAEIETAAKAKVAEQELFLKDKIAEAAGQGKYEEMVQLEQQLVREIRRINEDAEAKKAKVRG
jgi:hypothetical protein